MAATRSEIRAHMRQSRDKRWRGRRRCSISAITELEEEEWQNGEQDIQVVKRHLSHLLSTMCSGKFNPQCHTFCKRLRKKYSLDLLSTFQELPYSGLKKHMRTTHPGECLVCDFSYGAKNAKVSNGGGPKHKHTSYYVRQHMAHAHLFGEYTCHR